MQLAHKAIHEIDSLRTAHNTSNLLKVSGLRLQTREDLGEGDVALEFGWNNCAANYERNLIGQMFMQPAHDPLLYLNPLRNPSALCSQQQVRGRELHLYIPYA